MQAIANAAPAATVTEATLSAQVIPMAAVVLAGASVLLLVAAAVWRFAVVKSVVKSDAESSDALESGMAGASRPLLAETPASAPTCLP